MFVLPGPWEPFKRDNAYLAGGAFRSTLSGRRYLTILHAAQVVLWMGDCEFSLCLEMHAKPLIPPLPFVDIGQSLLLVDSIKTLTSLTTGFRVAQMFSCIR